MYPGARVVKRSIRTILRWLTGRRVVVRNVSMFPLLRPGDRVLFDRMARGSRAPERGEIVLARHPDKAKLLIIKIVAGMPGERVEVANGRLYIDGNPLAIWTPVFGTMPGDWRLGADEFFLLSYSLADGTDSRRFGPVSLPDLLGVARRVYWPAGRRRLLRSVIA